MESFTLTAILPAIPKEIYNAWLSSEGHSQMTGSSAEVRAEIGGAFKAWDDYIWGVTLAMEPHHRIVQAWRTSEFPEGSLDSHVEVQLEEAAGGTKITLVHSDIPDGQGESYKGGWDEFYFIPMRTYFGR